uniref:Uncharacterized protein n=1 Tax=Cacopsylla melanoneura TaxID=428564 RepID=A0A8D8UA67_9HEMI
MHCQLMYSNYKIMHCIFILFLPSFFNPSLFYLYVQGVSGESTPSGSEVPSSPPCPPSSRCGSPNRNTTSPAHPLCTGNVSKPCPSRSAATTTRNKNDGHCVLLPNLCVRVCVFVCV